MAVIESRDVDANGFTFETLVSGPADGEPVILLHGYPQSAGSWEQTLHWLAAHGYRGIAPNLRGYSPGANPPETAAYAMGELVGDVARIADELGVGRFHLVGHDWGGALAWGAAAMIPERLASLTVVSTPHPLALARAMRTSTQMLRSSYFVFFRLPRVPEVLLSAGNFAQLGASLRVTGLPREAWHRDRTRLRRTGLRGPLNWYRAASVPRKQSRISVPSLYIHGKHDFALGRHAANLTAQFVKGPYHMVSMDAGHWIPDRNADELNELLAQHLLANRLPTGSAAQDAEATADTATPHGGRRTAPSTKEAPARSKTHTARRRRKTTG